MALRLLSVLVLGVLLLGGLGCKSSSSTQPDSGVSVPCPPQASSTSGSASMLNSGQSVQNKICYEGTSNWYFINVPSGHTLLDISAGYSAAANTSIQLSVKVYYKTNSTTLTLLQDLVAASQSDAGVSSIQTTLHALEPGDYYLQASDAHNVNFDATNAYKLDVDYAVDPDSHEPNDTIADAKVSDSKPGYLAYLGDLDIFKTTVAAANDLVTLTLTNPETAMNPITYTISSSAGMVLYSNSAPPSNKPLTSTLSVATPGTYYLTLSYAMGATPSHAASSAYQLSFASRSNPDTVNNHTLANAVCPGGGSGPCSMAFSGSDVKLPSVSSYITVPGQRDFYRVDVASGAAAVLQMHLTSDSSTSVGYAVDLLTPDPGSPCTADTDCAAMNEPCNYTVDMMGVAVTTDCELSHQCLPPANYHFCSGGKACSLCQGAGLCIPGQNVCAVPQYLSAFSPSGKKVSGPTVFTAQPLFSNATYYVNVHDVQYTAVDLDHPYSLSLEIAPEPDANDQSTNAKNRNNFYDPYPNNMMSQAPNQGLAVDITSQLQSGTPVDAWISYQTDNDWYSFQHPCPGMNCALDISWVQPGPSTVQVVFYVINQDLTLHESFAYEGDPKKLTAPSMGSFDNQTCAQCSFASATEGDGGPYTYYLRAADVSQTSWDFTNGGKYSITIKKGADGCPAACSEATMPATCRCYCASTMSCPSPKF